MESLEENILVALLQQILWRSLIAELLVASLLGLQGLRLLLDDLLLVLDLLQPVELFSFQLVQLRNDVSEGAFNTRNNYCEKNRNLLHFNRDIPSTNRVRWRLLFCS